MHVSLSAKYSGKPFAEHASYCWRLYNAGGEGHLRLQSGSRTTAASLRSICLAVPYDLHWPPDRQGFAAIRATCALQCYAAA